MKNMRTVLLIIIMVIAITATVWVRERTRNDIVVFVIDSTSATLVDEQELLSQFNTFSHGEAVSKLVGTEVHRIFNVDDLEGNIDKDKYYNALFFVLNQVKKIGRSKRVVVNISLGSPLPDVKEYLMIRQLYSNDVIMVAAAGNEGMERCWYPAAYDEVISVGACKDSVIAKYSNNCEDIDIVASGKYTEIRTRTIFHEQSVEKLTLNGTSFSAPRVTGIVVKMLKEKPGLNKDEIVDILQRTSTELSFSECKGGRVNRLKALAEISDKYRRLYRLKNWSLFTIAALSTIILILFLARLILLPVLIFFFKLFLPGVWFAIKKRGIEKVMRKEKKSDRDIKFLIKCLIAQDEDLEKIAREALLDVSKRSIQNYLRVCRALRSLYEYVKVNDFVDEKKPIDSLLSEIGSIIGASESSDSRENLGT